MDLNLYLRVIWRFRFLVLVGVILAVGLAGLTMFKVSFHGASPKFSYRQHEVWQSQSVLLVTQRGFPEGRATNPFSVATIGGQQTAVPKFADPSRFTDLALFYSTLAQSDAVQRLMYRDSHVRGAMSATPALIGTGSKTAALPLFTIEGSASSAREAQATAAAGTAAFVKFLSEQQAAAGVLPSDRVVIEVQNSAGRASLATARKKTIPIVVLITVLIATLGLAFILENLRPLVRPVENPVADRAAESGTSIRSA
jgi:hypothetical protein